MIVKDEFLGRLRKIFDLNLYEVKVWTALLSRGTSTAGELRAVQIFASKKLSAKYCLSLFKKSSFTIIINPSQDIPPLFLF